MDKSGKFLLQVTGPGLLILLAVLYPVYRFGSTELLRGVFYGYAASAMIIVSGFFSIQWAFTKSTKTFFAVVLGGMFSRLLLVGGVLWWAWKYARVDIKGFVLALMASYLMLQGLEIRFVQRALGGQTAAKESGSEVDGFASRTDSLSAR